MQWQKAAVNCESQKYVIKQVQKYLSGLCTCCNVTFRDSSILFPVYSLGQTHQLLYMSQWNGKLSPRILKQQEYVSATSILSNASTHRIMHKDKLKPINHKFIFVYSCFVLSYIKIYIFFYMTWDKWSASLCSQVGKRAKTPNINKFLPFLFIHWK